MKKGNPEAVNTPYKGPAVSVRNKWYHINGVRSWLEKRGVSHKDQYEVCLCFMRHHGKHTCPDWNRIAIYVQNNWSAFTEWFNTETK